MRGDTTIDEELAGGHNARPEASHGRTGGVRFRGGCSARLVITLAAVAFAADCKREEPARPSATPTAVIGTRFEDVAAAAGLEQLHHPPILDHQLDNIMPWVCSVGAAAAAGDFDKDGWVDLYVTNSRKGTPNYLYRNNGDGTFTDVAPAAGLADLNGEDGTSMDSAWGDFDNDGWIDLYVVRWGRDALFRNNGDGSFSDVTRQHFRQRDGSPGTQWANGNAVIFFDYNLDGRLDLYIGNYFEEVDLWHLKSTRIMHDDFEKSRNGGRNFLYRQEPDGTFVEIAEDLGLDDPGWTLAVGSADIDNDGWADLYCADDFGPDQLFLNRRDGTFTNVSTTAIGIDSKKGMNVDFGDFNNDGWLDIYVTNITTGEYLQEGNMLWHNNGMTVDDQLTLTDISLETGTYDGGWGWGAKFFDYDRDGDLDIIALNGFVSAGEGNYWYDLASWTVTGEDSADARNWPAIKNRSFSGYETTRLWRNDDLFSYTLQAAELGLASTRDGRGVVSFDYDNDGDLDLFVANQGQLPHLYRNDGSDANHWLVVALEADPRTGTNRDAIGARVTVVTADATQVRERDGGNGFSAQSDPRLHFGLGSAETVTLLEVRWPDGGLQYVENVATDQFLRIRQDPERYVDQLAIAIDPPEPQQRREDGSQPKPPELSLEELDRLFSEMEDRIRKRPEGHAIASAYRARCAAYDQHDRAIDFFNHLIAENRDDVSARMDLACAYVDKIPTCGGLAAIVSKGTLARKSLDHLDYIIAKHDESWLAYYCRGMNHLHWPRALLHSDDAVEDFRKCIDLQQRQERETPPDHYLRSYLLLGDAHTKAKQYAEARKAWREGLAVFPNSTELKDRLAVSDDGTLLKFIGDKRSLQAPIDTDLSFYDRKP